MFETIGQRLKRERESRYLTLEKASADTRIRPVFIQALEADDYSVMPSAAQGRGFLRNYAEYLELNLDELIAEIQRNAPPPGEVSGPLPQVNLVETEIPPLTEAEDENPAPPFWTRWLGRRPKEDVTPQPVDEKIVETILEEPVPGVDVEATKSPKPRKGRKKKDALEESQPVVEPKAEPVPAAEESQVKPAAEIPLVEAEQVRVGEEAPPNLLARLRSILLSNFKKRESIPDIEPQPVVDAAPEVPLQPSLPADAILVEIGKQLRERRELISLTIEEVERHTHLRAVFVKALEEGAFDRLPSTVQTRGMLANYATFLDLDVDTVLLRFADALQARRREKYAETPREKIQMQVNPNMPLLRMFIASDLIFGVVMIAILVALAIWGVGRVVGLQAEEAEPTAPSIVDVLEDSSLPTATPELTFVAVDDPLLATAVIGGADVLVTEEVLPETTANVSVSLFALERVFVRISVDGETAFEGRMAPRETKVFEAEQQVLVLTGDGSALRITYNGRDLGLMGGVGEVISNVYTIDGVVTPTATIPPTPTNTLPVTPTLTPTVTQTPTATGTATTGP